MAATEIIEVKNTFHVDLKTDHKDTLVLAAGAALRELSDRKAYQHAAHGRTVDVIGRVADCARVIAIGADDRAIDRLAQALETTSHVLNRQIEADEKINAGLLDLANYGLSMATLLDGNERMEALTDKMRELAAEDHARANRWKPVSSPPMDGDTVLVKTSDGAIFMATWKLAQGAWYRATGPFPRYVGSVTHWAYAPESE